MMIGRVSAIMLAVIAVSPVAARTTDGGVERGADRGVDRRVDRGVEAAFHFAYPVYQIARTRAEAIAASEAAGRNVVNQFGHRGVLADHTHRAVTTPNNDTLYSSAWLDLSGGPVVIDMPALPDRYHSIALMDVFTDHFAVLGTRAQRGRGGRFLVTGPGWRGRIPDGMTRIRSPTNDAWALARVFVKAPSDLAAAAAAQQLFRLAPLDPGQATARQHGVPPRTPDPATFMAFANAFLSRGPLPRGQMTTARRLARFGIAPGKADIWSALLPPVRAAWLRDFQRHEAGLRAGFTAQGTTIDGWSYPRPGMGRFGQNHRYRAAVALGGLAALPVEEAVYITSVSDANGAALTGARCYRLRLPRDVPAAAFWSLSMYEIAPDGRLFFADNPIRRYAFNSAMPDLVRDANGTTEIRMGNSAMAKNWLPAPAGPFRITFRAYLPDHKLRSGQWTLPPLERCD